MLGQHLLKRLVAFGRLCITIPKLPAEKWVPGGKGRGGGGGGWGPDAPRWDGMERGGNDRRRQGPVENGTPWERSSLMPGEAFLILCSSHTALTHAVDMLCSRSCIVCCCPFPACLMEGAASLRGEACQVDL